MSRLRDYHRLLEQEDVTLARCVTVNPAENLPTPEDGEPHDCVQEAEKYSRLRSDLKALPLREVDLEYWTDGSCYRVGDKLSAGYAIVKAQGTGFVVEKAEIEPQPASAQLAELVGLTEACLLAEGKRVTIYTDSAYAHNVCHLFGSVWKNRGFKKTDGSPIQHHAQIMKLLHAMMKPKEIAIAKCAAHKRDVSMVTQGNKAADEAARAVTGADKLGEVFLVTHEVDLEDKIMDRDVILMQEAASAMDKQLWLDRGATQDSTGLWRSHEGLIIAPPDLLDLMIQEAHGLAHVARGEVRRKIMKEYGFWAPCLLEQIDYVIGRQRKEEVQERLDEQKRSTVQPGDKVFVKVFRRKWYNERREGPFEVVRSTGTAVQEPNCNRAGQRLTSSGLYKTVRRVLDIDGWYFMATEYLECHWCRKKVAGWSQDILEQLDPAHRAMFPAILTYRLSCDMKMDSTKKVTLKLAGAAARTAAWVTNVGNEHGQDPPGLQLYAKTGQLTKGGVVLPVYRCARGSTSLESFHRHLKNFIPGTSTNAENFQAYLLDGLARWNEDRAASAVDQAEQALRCYSGQLQHNLNQLSQQLLNRKLVEDYTKPGEYTGELIGVEYLYSQCQELREDIGRDPDAPDGTLDDESEWEDEVFDEIVGVDTEDSDPTIAQLSDADPHHNLLPTRNEAWAPPSPEDAASNQLLPFTATSEGDNDGGCVDVFEGPDRAPGYDCVVRLASKETVSVLVQAKMDLTFPTVDMGEVTACAVLASLSGFPCWEMINAF
ncbi:hypothetical protein MHYP_G00167460 [Metynnis hypsauchen]